jgi:hypothetical protein
MNPANFVYHVFKFTTTKCGLETKEVLGIALAKVDALVLARKEFRELINNRRMTQRLQILGFTPKADPVQLTQVA